MENLNFHHFIYFITEKEGITMAFKPKSNPVPNTSYRQTGRTSQKAGSHNANSPGGTRKGSSNRSSGNGSQNKNK